MTLSLSRRYLNKIGFQGSFIADLNHLQQLLALHLATFPFGNLSSYAGQPVSANMDDIANKLLERQREGYCIEHSSLTYTVLTELGYQARNLLGRVYYQKVHLVTPPLSHLVTVVTLDGQDYLFDPGFGGMTPAGVISFAVAKQPQQTPMEPFRVIKVEDSGLDMNILTGMTLMLQANIRGEWVHLYALNPQTAVAAADAATSNWYTSTSSHSLFTQQLMLARLKNQQRITLLGTTLRIHGKESSCTQQLQSFADFQHTVEQVLAINTQDVDLQAIYQRITSSSPLPDPI